MIDIDYAITAYLDVLAAERDVAEAEMARNRREQTKALSALGKALPSLAIGDLKSKTRQNLAGVFRETRGDFKSSVCSVRSAIRTAPTAPGYLHSSNDYERLLSIRPI